MNVQRGDVFWQLQQSQYFRTLLPEDIATLKVQGIGHFYLACLKTKENTMKWLMTTAALVTLASGSSIYAADGPAVPGITVVDTGDGKGNTLNIDPKSRSNVNVKGSADGKGNTLNVDPTAGSNVNIKGSVDGSGNTLVVGPDPHGTVTLKDDGNGKDNTIIVKLAPGEHLKIDKSGNGSHDKIIVERVPPIRPLNKTSPPPEPTSRGSHPSPRK